MYNSLNAADCIRGNEHAVGQIIGRTGRATYQTVKSFCEMPLTFTFGAFSGCFCPKRLTVIRTYVHTLMAVAAMQDARPAHQEQLGVRYFAQGHFQTFR